MKTVTAVIIIHLITALSMVAMIVFGHIHDNWVILSISGVIMVTVSGYAHRHACMAQQQETKDELLQLLALSGQLVLIQEPGGNISVVPGDPSDYGEES